MTPERLRQVANVLDVVIELDGPMRASYLDAMGAEDAELRRAVEDHLRQITGDEDPEPTTDSPTSVHGRAPKSEDQHAGGQDVGSRLGPYRIIDHLGVGGMGTVYLAEREDEQFERRVAVKVLRSGFDSPELIRRFVAERQILARLEHPHIARLYGGGTAADGRPYLAMEYVAGRPIDRYCDEEKLSIPKRLELIGKVCRAVQFAHRHLVVHRDLKPSNILVDGDGEPRLLDFGVAKLLDPASFPMTVEATRTGLSPMTPHYASPEQVSGGDITTATDVYALGVLLYRLLAGRLPYHFKSGTRNHILKVLEDAGPTRPSQVVLAETVDENGAALSLPVVLGLSPAELQRQLAGDLDSITLKALRPEPEHRYSSPELLAIDLDRHRVGLPVNARQGTWRYRFGKFFRRHRLASSIAATAIFAITLLAIFMTWQAATIAEQRNAAIAARDEARTAQQAEAQVVEFLTGLFKNADPRETRGQEVTARELLERGAERIRGELSDRPEVQSRLLLTMAEVYRELSLFRESAELASESAGLREASGLAAEDIAHARLTEAGALLSLGQLDDAEVALNGAEAALGEAASRNFTLSNIRGLLALHRGQFEAGAEVLSQAFLGLTPQDLEPQGDVPVATLARAHSNLGFAQEQLGQPEAAEASYRESLRLGLEKLGDDHPIVGAAYNNLGACLKDQGRRDEAVDAYRKALDIRVRVLGEQHLETAQTRANLAILDAEAGRWRDAVPAFQATIIAFEQHIGPEHPHVAMAWTNLGQCYRHLGEHDLARQALDRSHEIAVATLGAEHPIVAQAMLQQAALEADVGRPEAAEQLFDRVGPILDASVGRPHRLHTALLLARCSAASQSQSGVDHAIERCEEALETLREQGDSRLRLATLLANLATAQMKAGDLDAARQYLDEAREIAEATSPENHPERIVMMLAESEWQRRNGDVDAARVQVERALAIADQANLATSHTFRKVGREILAKLES